MINDQPAASAGFADAPDSPLTTTVNRPRQRHRPTVVDDSPSDWEWEDWAARFWASEPRAVTGEDPWSDGH